MKFNNSIELCKYVSEISNSETLLSFSCGKDSICSWLQLRKYFDIIHPFYLYLIPDLEFVENSLTYYETYFNTHIIRLPHPSLFRWLNNCVLVAPEHLKVLKELNLPTIDYDYLHEQLKYDLELSQSIYVATGIRQNDSLMRRTHIKQRGVLIESLRKFYPIYDWANQDIYDELTKANIKLPIDYKFWGRTFDGLDYKYSSIIKREFPNDYEKIKELFNLIDVELIRYQL